MIFLLCIPQLALALLVSALVGAGRAPSSPPATPADLELAAGGAYAAEHMACVERYRTDPEIDACRADVRKRWGIAETSARGPRDAGADR